VLADVLDCVLGLFTADAINLAVSDLIEPERGYLTGPERMAVSQDPAAITKRTSSNAPW